MHVCELSRLIFNIICSLNPANLTLYRTVGGMMHPSSGRHGGFDVVSPADRVPSQRGGFDVVSQADRVPSAEHSPSLRSVR